MSQRIRFEHGTKNEFVINAVSKFDDMFNRIVDTLKDKCAAADANGSFKDCVFRNLSKAVSYFLAGKTYASILYKTAPSSFLSIGLAYCSAD